jgi:hypothetical protein
MTAPKDMAIIDYQAQTFAAAFAVPGGDDGLEQRVAEVESIVSDAVTGNAALNDRIAHVDSVVNDDLTGNAAVNTVVRDPVIGNQKLSERIERNLARIRVLEFLLVYRDALGKGGVTSPLDLKRAGEARASERRKQYEAMGGASGAGFSLEEYGEACKVAREAL